MKNFFLAAGMTALLIGCNSDRYQQSAVRYHEDGRAKAVVTLTPVFDHHDIHLPWSLADDLTEMIKTRLLKKANVYVGNADALTKTFEDEEQLIEKPLQHYDENKSASIHVDSLKLKFPKSEFVVFLELAEHEIHPKTITGSFVDALTPSQELLLAMRVRIYDLRFEKPQIILQELVEQSHLVPKQLAKLDYDSPIWGKKTYSISPVGFAHAQLAKEVASRIENYLILAKTK
jgi:hypothetical protein